MKRLYIIKIGTTFPATASKFGDFELWTAKALGETVFETSVVDAAGGQPLPTAGECAGVVITGSHAMVTDELSWSVGIESWIPSLMEANIPLLGICYGHQLLARAMGGRVGYLRHGQEIGTVAIECLAGCDGDILFKPLPRSFPAHVSHKQTVLALPPGAVPLAANAHEPHHAFRLGGCAWGVQFHPEYSAGIMRSYIEEQTYDLERAGMDVKKLLNDVKETPVAERILKRFARFVEERLAVQAVGG